MPSEMPAKVELTYQDDTAVLSIGGDFDYSRCGLISDQFALIEEKGRVVLDLSEAVYFDSEILKVILNCSYAVIAQGGRIAISGPDGQPKKILEVCGISELIPMYPDLESAMRYVSQSGQ